MNTCVKIIDNCLDCNSCFVDRILTADSWDHEEGAYCKEVLKNGKPRLIASDDWDLRKWSKVPDWCPKLIKSRLNKLRIEAGVLDDKKFDKKLKSALIVNLFGVPGAGKSTGAAYIFSRLKMHGINAELVTEFAKDKVWENNEEVFNNQAYIFGKQSFKISRCANKVDVVITDSPLPLSIFYNNDPLLTENFNASVMDVFNGYRNVNFLITRTKPYNPIGRQQTEKESDEMKKPIIDLLTQRGITYQEVPGEVAGYDVIVNKVLLLIRDNGEPKNEQN